MLVSYFEPFADDTLTRVWAEHLPLWWSDSWWHIRDATWSWMRDGTVKLELVVLLDDHPDVIRRPTIYAHGTRKVIVGGREGFRFELKETTPMAKHAESKFWMVWNPARNEWPPSVRHSEKETATREAERIARETRKTVYVLEAVQAAVPPADVEIVNLQKGTVF